MNKLGVDHKTLAFPSGGAYGMTLRDYFAIHGPAPNPGTITMHAQREQDANPHGDSYKPKRRSLQEIETDLRYEWADAMMEARKPRG